jgi:DNA-damage-inducible protein D
MDEFEEAKRIEGGEEYWSARTLGVLLGYKSWESFERVIKKGIIACINNGGDQHIHFREAQEIVMAGISYKPIDDFQLTRWGAYLAAMNGNPGKERIAFAQAYFLVRTRQAEIIEQRLMLNDRVVARRELAMSEADFSKAMIETAKLTGKEVAEVRARGDKALLGKTTEEMKRQYGMVDKKGNTTTGALGDRLPTVVQRGKAFAAELTKERINQGLVMVRPIAKAHEAHNAEVRQTMLNANIIPEKMEPGEDTKILERAMKREEKDAQKSVGAKRQLSMKAPDPMPALEEIPPGPPEGHNMTPLPFDE